MGVGGAFGVRNLTAVVGCACLVAAGASGVIAAKAASPHNEERRQQLFAVMISQPDNLDAAFEYAALSSLAGDYEAAASTLQRMLIFAPRQPRVLLELGVTYYRLGSFGTAKNYLELVMAAPDVSAEVADKAKLFLDAAERELNSHKFTAASYSGIRWHSNANLATGKGTIPLGILGLVPLSSTATKQSDFSVFSATSAHYSYDLQSQGDRLEVDYAGYSAYYFEESQLDHQLAELTVGPSFNLARFDIDDTDLGVYAIVNGALLGKTPYFGSLGAGIKLASLVSQDTRVSLKGEYRRVSFDSSNTGRPRASIYDGEEFRLYAAVKQRLDNQTTAIFAGRVNRKDARVNFQDKWEYGGHIQLNHLFDGPIGMADQSWAASLSGGYLRRDYDAPDPVVNPAAKERDNEYWARASLNIPINKWAAVRPQIEYRAVDSNVPIRDYNAFTAIFGIYITY